jgi:hypothetical protein
MPATEQDDILLTYFQRLPKVELHLHLEGAIPLPSLWRLIEKYGGERRQHERPPRPRAPAPAPRPQAITPPAPHADPPLEPQAQLAPHLLVRGAMRHREGRLSALWRRLRGRPVSESGRLRHGDGGHEGGDRRRRVLVLPTLLI